MDELELVLRSTTERASFGECSFSTSDLQSVISSASHINTLSFTRWKFNIKGSLILTGPRHTIKRLYFKNWGDKNLSGWISHPEKLEILIKAITDSEIIDSIEELRIKDKKLNYNKVQQILNNTGHIFIFTKSKNQYFFTRRFELDEGVPIEGNIL